jgi:uncharacterized protein YfiM (DUF2279 family)
VLRARRAIPLTLLALVALLGTVRPAGAGSFLLPADQQGGWLAADKELHFAASLAISASARSAGASDGTSFGVAVGAGTLKELWDATFRPGRPGASWKDLVADIAGAAAGFLIVDAIDR